MGRPGAHGRVRGRIGLTELAETETAVKFVLLDRIIELEPGQRIVACKALSLAEEYLADHFPKFPVLPGVLMLEALVQTSAWVVREKYDFRPSLIVLKEARNITYKSFLAPGQLMTMYAECKSLDENESTFSARGEVNGREIVKGRLILRHLSLADQDANWAETDELMRARMRTLYGLLRRGHPSERASDAASVH